jgi:DNA-directed RNA polymerase specialized sigma24 family protein
MTTGNATKEASDSSDGFLSAEEVTAAAKALPAADKQKLNDIEKVRRRGTGYGPGQLLHEAMCRIWLGDRKCPRNVHVMAFLVKTMQSIAYHDREARKRMRTLHAVPREGAAISTAVAGDVDMVVHAAMDRAARELEAVDEICDLFSDDPDAQYVILAWSEGRRGADLQDATGLDKAGVERVAKRIRKKMRSIYPDGRTK